MGAKQSIAIKVAPLPPSLWINLGFDIIQFTGFNLPFSEKFPGDYKTLSTKTSFKLTDMKENHLLRGLMLERINWEILDQVKKS